MRKLPALLALAVLVPLVGVPKPAQADPPTTCDRSAVVTAWRNGGPQVRSAAEQALLAGNTEVCAFLDTGWTQRGQVDDRVAVNQMMAAGGPAVRTAAQTALDSTDPEALGRFLEQGWTTAGLSDQRVGINQMMAAGG